jgi:LuxR family maltose regulon positive regulatory protein
MPRTALHSLIWSSDQSHYELYTHSHLEQCFRPEDEEAWFTWLEAHSSFAFQGQVARLNVHKEARPRGQLYWYAYRFTRNRTLKHYLGRSARVTFAHLEDVARVDQNPPPSQTKRGPITDSSSDSGYESSKGSMPVLQTKFAPPRLPTSLVERSRLLTELDMILSHRLTLVSASAGSGKTTLLSAWVAASSQTIAWLSLDALDNTLTRFWGSVIAALRICLPKIGEEALIMLHSPQPPPLSTILAILLGEMEQVGREIILILDDYHVISEQIIGESLLTLLDHLPANLHVVLSSRTDPELPISRFRVRGQTLEIGDSDLRFTREETASFLLQVMGLPLSKEDVATLQKRTEGWIAGLQLAALSMRKRNDPGAFVQMFAGSHRFVLDYVQEEVLQRQPMPVQRFLLQIAVLNRMNAAICEAVTQDTTSQQLLEWLERNNLFVAQLDEQQQWYRLHDLFREALLIRLRAGQPELLPVLHQRAARWYDEQGYIHEAIMHALAAADYSFAVSLIERAAEQFWLTGEATTVQNWVLALPDAVLHIHARLALNATLRLLNSVHMSTEAMYNRTRTVVEQTIARIEGILRRAPEQVVSDAEGLVIRRLSLLRALIEAIEICKLGDKERLRILSQEIEKLPQDEEVIWNLIPLSFIFWLNYTLLGESAFLVPRLLEVRQQAIRAGDQLATIRVMLWLASVYVTTGQLYLAHQEALSALALVEQIGGHTAMAGYLYGTLSEVYYAWNRQEEASDALNWMLHIGHGWKQVDLLYLGEEFLAQLSLAKGDLAAAQQALQKLETLCEREGLNKAVPLISTLRVQWWLAQGHLAEASDWAAQTTFHSATWDFIRKEEFLTLIRVYFAQQQYPLAVEMLERWRQSLDQPGNSSLTIKFLTLYVVALHYAGKREQARVVAARLLSMTEPEGFIRVYLDAGEQMKQVLKTLLEEDHASTVSISRSYVSRLLAAFGREEQKRVLRAGTHPVSKQGIMPHLRSSRDLDSESLMAASGEQRQGSEQEQRELTRSTFSTVQPWRFEPLSRQELRVLRLLAAGRTYGEMAEALIVSLNTIKTQVSSIYRKLGVSRRAEAIVQARRLHLL